MIQMQDMMIQTQLSQIPAGQKFKDPEALKKLSEFIRTLSPSYDEIVNQFIPIWEKHFTLSQVQELNKFYSTSQMQALVNQQPAIMTEIQPILAKTMHDMQEKFMEPKVMAQAQKILEPAEDPGMSQGGTN
jgi:hypothetical protein